MRHSSVHVATAMIGKKQYDVKSDVVVNRKLIDAFLDVTGTDNPLYFDKMLSKQLVQGEIAPVTMLSSWCRPNENSEIHALQLHYDLKSIFKFPVAIVVEVESQFHEPVLVGDRLSSYQVLKSISDEKILQLGRGRFWAIEVHYQNQRGVSVGVDSYSCFGYHKVDTE